jgi:hypothetical protein
MRAPANTMALRIARPRAQKRQPAELQPGGCSSLQSYHAARLPVTAQPEGNVGRPIQVPLHHPLGIAANPCFPCVSCRPGSVGGGCSAVGDGQQRRPSALTRYVVVCTVQCTRRRAAGGGDDLRPATSGRGPSPMDGHPAACGPVGSGAAPPIARSAPAWAVVGSSLLPPLRCRHGGPTGSSGRRSAGAHPGASAP